MAEPGRELSRNSGFPLAARMGMGAVACAAALSLCPAAGAAPAPAGAPGAVDGRFADWPGTGETTGPLDLRVAGDRDRLVFAFTLPSEIVLQGDPGVDLYLDLDHDPATGLRIQGIGADLTWSFASREGRAYVLGLPVRVTAAGLDLRQAPTVSARRFEVALDRRPVVAGAAMEGADTVSVVVCARGRAAGGGAEPVCDRRTLAVPGTAAPPPEPRSLDRERPGDLRVLTYNVRFDGLFTHRERFARILAALDPDVVLFQEVFNHEPEETRDLMAEILPGRDWQAVGAGSGVVVSAVPVAASGALGGKRDAIWVRLESPGHDWPEGPLLLNLHPPCCDNDAGRREELDQAAAWIRDARAAGRLDPATPVLVAGDMNLVGDASEQRTLLAGTIADTLRFGPPAAPDGDGTPFADAFPRHLAGGEVYTWRSDEGPFAPGRLDYIVYTDSVLEIGNRFVLWTPDLPPARLEALGLEPDDTAAASDHLPVVADFRYSGAPSR